MSNNANTNSRDGGRRRGQSLSQSLNLPHVHVPMLSRLKRVEKWVESLGSRACGGNKKGPVEGLVDSGGRI
jgi:hypothetical protein